MSSPQDVKIVFAGPRGAGKSTAIHALSDHPPRVTEVAGTERVHGSNDVTIVALEFGQLALEDGTAVRLYGAPAQARFSFVGEILCEGSLGVVLLVDGRSATALSDLETYLDMLERLGPGQSVVVGVGRLPVDAGVELDRLAAALAARDTAVPVFGVDVRRREDVLLLVQTLLCVLELRVPDSLDDVH
jgi:signal recognition particle receptor subunit beta